MKLTSFSNYTMRILMVAAMRDPALTTIQDVADGFGIAKSHLVKCVHQLGAWGYLITVRGNRGGFRLARTAATITLGEIIRRTEEGFSIAECFDPASNRCPLIDQCRLRPALQRATDAFLTTLDGITLADITDNDADLLPLLAPPLSRPTACQAVDHAAI